MRSALAILITAMVSIFSVTGVAQSPAAAAQPRSALPASAISGTSSSSSLLQPSLDAVRRSLDAVRVDKWKKGSIRDEASANIEAIQRDLQTNMPPLLREADAAPGSVGRMLPLLVHVNAIYDVLLRVVEGARVIAPDEQAAQLQQALTGLSSARLAYSNRVQASADAEERQLADLRASLQAETARRLAAPVPAAVPCVPPPTHRTTKKTAKKPAAGKPATSPSN